MTRADQLSDATVFGACLTGPAIRAAVRAGTITIEPFAESQLDPTSYTYRLGPSVRRLTSAEIDLRGREEYEELIIGADGLVLEPNECYLGHTVERVGSEHYAGLITGRSSIGRRFVTNHVSAGLVHVGFLGQLTLEIVVQRPTRVYANTPFGQILWLATIGTAAEPYRSAYMMQEGPTPARPATLD
jgi:dCTP deaminase